MRDKNRIKPFLESLQKLWLRYPDYRFGQLIYLLIDEIGQDIFFPEEDAWINTIERLIAEYDEYERNNPKIEYKDVDLYEIVEDLMNLKNTNKYNPQGIKSIGEKVVTKNFNAGGTVGERPNQV